MARRIAARREREDIGFASYLGDYGDIAFAYLLLVLLRLLWLPSLTRYCHQDYIAYWYYSHDNQPPILWMYMGVLGLVAIWLIFRLVYPPEGPMRMRWFQRTVRVVMLVVIVEFAVGLLAMVPAMQDYASNLETPGWSRNLDYWSMQEKGPHQVFRCPKLFLDKDDTTNSEL